MLLHPFLGHYTLHTIFHYNLQAHDSFPNTAPRLPVGARDRSLHSLSFAAADAVGRGAAVRDSKLTHCLDFGSGSLQGVSVVVVHE